MTRASTAKPSPLTRPASADYEHSDHQLRVDRGSADVAVERRQLLAKVSQHPRHDWVDAAQEMIRGNVFFEVEKIEQLALINRLTTHHDLRPSLKSFRRRNHDSPIFTRTFNSIGQTENSRQGYGTAGLPSTTDIFGHCRDGRRATIVFSN